MTAFDQPMPMFIRNSLDTVKRLYHRVFLDEEPQDTDDFDDFDNDDAIDFWEPAETLQSEADRESERSAR